MTELKTTISYDEALDLNEALAVKAANEKRISDWSRAEAKKKK